MLQKTALYVATAVLFLCTPKLEAALLWSDGFETGEFGAWSSVTGNWTIISSSQSAHTGTKGVDVKGNTEPVDDMLTAHVSLIGYKNAELSYWFKVKDGLDPADAVAVQWTVNGIDWLELTRYSDVKEADWQHALLPLPASANNREISFRLRATLSSGGDRMGFDDFSVSGEPVAPVPEPSGFALPAAGTLFAFLRLRKRAM